MSALPLSLWGVFPDLAPPQAKLLGIALRPKPQARVNDTREARRAAGLCFDCGATPREGRTRCASCAERKREVDAGRVHRRVTGEERQARDTTPLTIGATYGGSAFAAGWTVLEHLPGSHVRARCNTCNETVRAMSASILRNGRSGMCRPCAHARNIRRGVNYVAPKSVPVRPFTEKGK